jgi:hypothetical protein
VWIASLSATAGFKVERRELDQNAFYRIRVRDEDPSENPEQEKVREPPGRASARKRSRSFDRDGRYAEPFDFGRDAGRNWDCSLDFRFPIRSRASESIRRDVRHAALDSR